jgi:3-methyladenine DNA glycosylase AlkD
MLREVGKRDRSLLEQFLKVYAATMPRTMLRYAIEKFSEEKRRKWMGK